MFIYAFRCHPGEENVAGEHLTSMQGLKLGEGGFDIEVSPP